MICIGIRGDESVDRGACGGGGRPGGADRPGGTTGSPGGTAGKAGVGSGDTGKDAGGVLARGKFCEGMLSASATTGEGDRAAGIELVDDSFCLLVFGIKPAIGRLGVDGRDDGMTVETFVTEVLRSFAAGVASVLLPAAMEPDRC